jgi:ankyrin repeat protein
MFSPVTWGSAASSLLGREVVYKSGEIMGHSRLHTAVTQGWEKDALEQIKNGADINMVNSKGNTPLDDAIRERRTTIEKVLIDNGAKRSNELKK